MRHLVVTLLACTALAGCRILDRPMRVNSNATARVTTEMPAVPNASPVFSQTVPRYDNSGPKIALVDVDGLLLNMDMTGLGSQGENPVSIFREKLDTIAADQCVRAVVVRINSPGGGVTATDVMWHDLQAFKQRTGLPVVACLMDLGAGGAYYLATAADEIIAHPTTVTGGIGVILNVYNLQDAMAQFNVVAAPVKSGSHIDMGTPIAPLDDDKRQLLQDMADEFHARFRRIVVSSRPLANAGDATLFDGRVFTAGQAYDRHLIDTIGYLDDAVQACHRLSGVGQARVVLYHRSNDRARSQYSITPNVPLQGAVMPVSLPGLDRAKLPSFLYLWQPEPSMEKLGGR